MHIFPLLKLSLPIALSDSRIFDANQFLEQALCQECKLLMEKCSFFNAPGLKGISFQLYVSFRGRTLDPGQFQVKLNDSPIFNFNQFLEQSLCGQRTSLFEKGLFLIHQDRKLIFVIFFALGNSELRVHIPSIRKENRSLVHSSCSSVCYLFS